LLLPLIISVTAQTSVDSLVRIVETAKADSSRIDALVTLSLLYINQDLSQSVEYGTQAVELARRTADQQREYMALKNLALAKYYQGNYPEALLDWQGCIHLLALRDSQESDSLVRKEILSKKAMLLNNVAVVYKNLGEYEKAIEYSLKNLLIQEEIGDLKLIAMGRSNIASVYFHFGLDYDKALEFYNESLELFSLYTKEHPEDNVGRQFQARAYLNLGIVYKETEDYTRAIENYQTALKLFTVLGDRVGIAHTKKNIGLVNIQRGSFQEALDASLVALSLYREIGQRKEEADVLKSIGLIYYKWGKFSDALEFMNRSLEISRELGLKRELFDVYKDISDVYRDVGDYRQALENHDLYTILKDSSIREDNLKQLSELETKYETEKVERENVLLNTQNILQETELIKQRIILYSVIGITMIVFVFGFVTYRHYQAKKRANVLLEELNFEVNQQKDIIEKKNLKITSSINYARHIQESILLTESEYREMYEKTIVYYRPRDVVSGDFYWFHRLGDLLFAAAVDCTGHGVPGAFMCMIGDTLLNEIIIEKKTAEPVEILSTLNQMVRETLRQEAERDTAQDGMDMSMAVFDLKSGLLKFAGAKNSIYLVKEGDIEELAASPWSIGGISSRPRFIKKVKFTQHERTLSKGTQVYFYSDGYMDQFEAGSDEKFGKKRFKELLASTNGMTLEQIRKLFSDTMDDWKGQSAQLDDMLIIGIQF